MTPTELADRLDACYAFGDEREAAAMLREAERLLRRPGGGATTLYLREQWAEDVRRWLDGSTLADARPDEVKR